MNQDMLLEYLKQLAAEGDGVNAKAVAERMGLGRQDGEDLAVRLMTDGLLEMVSLSGAVRVTAAGRGLVAGVSAAASGDDDLPALLAQIGAAGDLGLGPVDAADLAADAACLAAHLRRSRPLPPVVRACLASLSDGLAKSSSPQAAGLLPRVDAFLKK